MARKRYRRRRKNKSWGKKSDYTCLDGSTVSMDSTWEVACAERLDALDVKWERDPSIKLQYRDKKFRPRNYIPDFYLPEIDIYLEVKGYWTIPARWKMRDIMQRNPGKICILESLDSISRLALPILPTTGSVM
ncbi:MAG TPA: hypothetical protein EYF95_04105 [Flavobacteriales bacterium]|jgi:predicted nuclease of restriction endonuclease-like RecB superfamily|nr:hypothetical protein [Flavobacteriales bacterium]